MPPRVDSGKIANFAAGKGRPPPRPPPSTMKEMNQRAAAALRQAVESLSDGDGLSYISPTQWRGGPLPSQQAVGRIAALARALLFPGFFGEGDVSADNAGYHIGLWADRLYRLLSEQVHAGLSMAGSGVADRADAADRAAAFIQALPELRRTLATDVVATYHGDPAAESPQEVAYCYPGIKAIANYRIAHQLLTLGVPLLPRMITEQAHSETGIDIHPGATIGPSFTIDHGTGVVIGATAILGHHVKIYQGVTLGARSFDLDDEGHPIKGIPRHPIIGNNVIIYSNATILGRITIGDNAVVGGNIWVTNDVAPGERLIQAKADNILRIRH